jgi:hypothetical protein
MRPSAPPPEAPLRRLASLPPAESALIWKCLLPVPAQAQREGWLEWELDEPLAAHARKLAVRLTAAEKAAILAARV